MFDRLELLDRKSADFLAYMTSNMDKDSVLLCGMYRGDQITGECGFQRILPRIKGNANLKEVKLSLLLARDILPMIQSIISPLQIDSEKIALLYKATRGLPYVLIELLKELADQDKIIWQDGAWNLDFSNEILRRCSKGAEELLIQNYDKIGKHHQSILEWISVASFALKIGRASCRERV